MRVVVTRRPFGLSLALAFSVAVINGCAFSIDAEVSQPPPAGVTAIVVGGIESADPERDRIARRFRRTLATALKETKAFEGVLSAAPARPPEEAVLITGRFDKASEGSEILRFGLGLGAGSPSLRARFEITDDSGRILAAWEEDARSFDGTGYAAHWNPASLDELVDRFAEKTADAIARWRRGKELASTIW